METTESLIDHSVIISTVAIVLSMPESITLLHVSDFHFTDETLLLRKLIRKEGLLSKRIAGWVNNKMNRSGHCQTETRTRLIEYLKQADWDYLIFSGDLTTLALEQEFREARKQFESLIKKGPVIMTAGNHDRYVRRAIDPDLMTQTFSDCFPYNQRSSPDQGIRYLELGSTAVLFEIDMACPRFYLSARGKIQSDLKAMGAFIADNYRDRLKLVVGHYLAFLPQGQKEGLLHQLADIKRLQQFLLDNNIDLYFHGHIHNTWQLTDPVKGRTISLNAGGCCRYTNGPWSGFHKITLTGNRYHISRINLSSSA